MCSSKKRRAGYERLAGRYRGGGLASAGPSSSGYPESGRNLPFVVDEVCPKT